MKIIHHSMAVTQHIYEKSFCIMKNNNENRTKIDFFKCLIRLVGLHALYCAKGHGALKT